MKRKMIVGIMLMLLLTSVLSVAFYFVLVVSPAPEGPIKIGVMAPLSWLQGQGIMEGATLAAEEINATGGILGRNVTLVFANTTSDPEAPSPIIQAVGITAAEELIAAGVDFAIGGFRSEAVFGAREVFMNHTKIFIIAGAVADELIDCGDGTCGACVRCNYTRYKYLFRTSPINLTFCFRQLTSFLATYLLPEKLVPVYGSPVKVAVITENLTWTEEMHENLTNPAIYADMLGPHANVTYSTRVRHNATDLTAEMTAIKESGARLIIHMFSGIEGIYFVGHWRAMEVEAIPVGINVLSQRSEMWNLTAGKCEYETILATTGTRTPITNSSIPFWNAYVARWGHDPKSTSWGAYEAIYTLKEAIERAETIDSDAVVAELEKTDRIGTIGRFKFTGTNGTLHDLFCSEIGSTWTQGYVRPFMVQWQAGKREVIWPADQQYSKEFALLPWMPEPEPIKIGVLGPMAWIQGQGIKEGAVLAAEEINATGGILGHPVEIIAADTLRGQPIPNATTGIAAAEELIAAGVDFAVGGFRTEAVFGAREVFMNHSCIYFIAGAATDGLVDCAGGSWLLLPNGTIIQRPHCGACVRCNYTRYKYLFRVTPVNSTSLARSLWAFLRFVLEDKLLDLYGVNGKVKVAVVSENLAWADTIHSYMTNPAAYSHPGVLGPYANVTYSARPPYNETDFSAYLTAIETPGARLIIHVFSAEAGRIFINQWGEMKVEAVPVGINVDSQESNMWNLTGGNCEYETILAGTGTRTPVTNLSIPFWNAYVARWGHDPIYTSWGAYDAIISLDEMFEANFASMPDLSNQTVYDDLIPLIEQTDRLGTLGRFKYTGPNPNLNSTNYPFYSTNPNFTGTLHDVFCNEIGSTWTQGYVRPFMVQWKAGKKEVIWPADKPYSKEYRLPPWMCIRVPENYSTIQEAINAAPPGASICVSPGTYHEAVVINKTLTLIGKNRSNTIIDGSGLNYTGAALVTITADDVDMSGFTVTNAGLRGINVENSRYCEVHETIVCFTGDRGIVFASGGNNKAYDNVVYNSSAYGGIEAIWSNNNTIYNNLAYFNQWGIAANNGSYNRIYNNTLYSNRAQGIHMDWSSTGNVIYNNNVSSNTMWGISVRNQASENVISGNEISGNNDTGILLHSSSNNTLTGNNVTDNKYGIVIQHTSSNNTITNNTVSNNNNYGIVLQYTSSNNKITNNTVSNNLRDGILITRNSHHNEISGNNITLNGLTYVDRYGFGILLWNISYSNMISSNNITNNYFGVGITFSSFNNTVRDNTVLNNSYIGILVYENSSYNIIQNNYASGNSMGIVLSFSCNNTLTGNNMTGNTHNFGVDGYRLSDFIHNIDTSNTVDGKPIHYIINERNFTIDPDTFPNIGYLGLVNSTNINVRNLKLTKNVQGVLCAFLTNSTIENVNLIGNWVGLAVAGNCSGTLATGNIMSMNGLYGVVIANLTSGISLHNNIISNNEYGLYVMGSDNTFIGNTIINNEYGVLIWKCGGNVFYHNNFVNNMVQANVTSGYVNTWDDGYSSGGNYWSDYEDRYPSAEEIDDSGIWDTPYVIDANNTDNYPLMEAWGQGDVNLDGIVDIFDGVVVAAALGARLITDPQDPRFGEYWHDEACLQCPHDPRADINQDGVIDGSDLEIVDNNYGKTW